MTVTKPKQTATLFIVALLLAILAGSPPQSDAATRLVLTTSLPITELSFDDSRLAWVQNAPHPVCGSANAFSVHRHSFVTRRATRLVNPRCVVTSTGYFGRLVLAGARVYWAQSQGGNSSRTWSVWTTSAPGQATKLIERAVGCGAACSCSPPALGTDLGNTDGAGSTFLFTSRDMAPSPTCPPGGDEGIVTSSRLTRVTAGPSGLVMGNVPGAPGSVGSTIAYAAGRVALVPLENGEPPSHDPGRVEIRDVATGALVSQFTPAAPVRAVALSQSVAAVLTKAGGSARIETYDVQTGALRDSWTPRNAIFPSLDLAGQRIVYRVGTEIRVLRIDTGGSRVLHRAQGSSFFSISAPQIEGNRVVWYVRSQGHSRVYELMLP
ncbi:MAG: hypothetical protein ACRDM2_01080 [Gaiellaceae bacterium]